MVEPTVEIPAPVVEVNSKRGRKPKAVVVN